jgi:hypothetical protein
VPTPGVTTDVTGGTGAGSVAGVGGVTGVPGAGPVRGAHGVVVGAPGAVLAPAAERTEAGPGPVRHGRRAARRPGPPARIAVPVLLLALVCYAVGFWALARI